jgi:TRAP-type mannitol/chloroaromatic compound transport system substrate-binding protein
MLNAFRSKWDEVVVEQSAKDPEFKRVYDNLQSFRKDYELWSGWAFMPRPGTQRIAK